MPDQHNNTLASFYKSQIGKAKAYLQAKYTLTICDATDDEVRDISKPTSENFCLFESWKVALHKYTFIVAIPNSFPDTFPKIYLQKKDHEKIYPIPHLDKDRFVCTRDPEVVVINDKKPGEALEELLKIAERIIEAGISKENLDDYAEEFIAYWAERADRTFLSLFTPRDEVDFLTAFTLSDRLFDAWYVISDSEASVEKWLAPFQIRIDRGKEITVLYLPLRELSPHFFERKKGILEILRDLKQTEEAKIVEKYFNKSSGRVTLLMSFPIKGDRVLFGWTFPGWKSIKGFSRKDRVPLQVRLTQTDHNRITGINIKRMDKQRILLRGGSNNLLVEKNFSVVLIGCGSLGSYLAMSLARCGMSKYLLIDNQELEPENIARHLCGFVDASKKIKKVEAVKKRLRDHFPHIECEVYADDVLKLLSEDGTNCIDSHDLTIVAIGNTAVERRVNYLVRKSNTPKSIIYLWIEPLGVAGHVLFAHPEDGGCFDCCFDQEGQFLYQVASQRQEFSRREAGCQSTYTPYAALDVEHFISVACKRILKIIECKESKSKLYTWLGDLEAFKNLGHKINDRYVTDLSYTTIEKGISTNETCTACKKENKTD